MASPHLLRLSSTPISPLEYFTDSSNTINFKSDVILVVENQRFYCHRLLLSLVSPVFARMFDGQFKEHEEQEVPLEGKTSESIIELLKFIYPQFNGQITNENIENLIKLADEYMIEHLKQPCKNFLVTQLESFKYVVLPTKQKLEQVQFFSLSSRQRKTHSFSLSFSLRSQVKHFMQVIRHCIHPNIMIIITMFSIESANVDRIHLHVQHRNLRLVI